MAEFEREDCEDLVFFYKKVNKNEREDCEVWVFFYKKAKKSEFKKEIIAQFY